MHPQPDHNRNVLPTVDRDAFFNIVANLDKTEGREILLDLIETFLSEIHTGMEKLRLAVDIASTDTIWKTAHTLKGASLPMGAQSFAQACARLEIATRKKETDQPQTLMQDIETAYEELKKELHKLHKELKGE